MSSISTNQPKILVVQNELLAEMKLVLEYAGNDEVDAAAIGDQMKLIVRDHEIGAAILDTGLEREAATAIADTLLEMHVPFVFAGASGCSELPGRAIAQTMEPALASLTVLGNSILGQPTFH